ncbi:MAG: NAD(P)H-dependent oxidoreductase [Methanomicrobiaceae archaeon]|nr:NAD(P)H-dependent oxidoreductase [Methanomicrobiaceae archaeon]
MKVLYVYAHPEPKSFNGALKTMAVNTLLDRRHYIEVSDLYRMRFNPVAGPGDYLQRMDPEVFDPQDEALHAANTESFARDIYEEMEKVGWADLIIFQFPLWFASVPAILKGWFDRVFAVGVAFNPMTGSIYDRGMLAGRSAMLVVTAGDAEAAYGPDGIHGDIHTHLAVLNHCTLAYAGLSVLPPHIIYEADTLSGERGRQEIERYRERLLSVLTEEAGRYPIPPSAI